ncbi:MAG: GntR family transcriptional regulator [Frankia sp.]
METTTMGDYRRRHLRVGTQTSRRRAYDLLRAGIRAGVVEEQLIEDALTRALWTSRNAVRDALQMLVEEGLVSRRPRHGTNVVRRIASVPLQELMPPPTGRPGEAGVRVRQMETRTVPISGIVANRLATSQEFVTLSEQLIFIDDEAVCLRTAYMVTDLTPAEAEKSLGVIDATHIPSAEAFKLFFGVPMGEVESTIEAIPGERDACRALGMVTGAPVLFRESIHRDVNGRPRMLLYAHYRGDRIALSTLTHIDERDSGYAESESARTDTQRPQ